MSCDNTDQYPLPVNPEATPEAKKLLRFIHSIKGEYLLTGQHNYLSRDSYTEKAKEITGKYPVVWGCDFRYQRKNKPEWNNKERKDVVEEAIKHYKRGHIITLMWHCCYPEVWQGCSHKDIWTWQKRLTKSDWENLTTEGTELNEKWKKQVDQIADLLKILRDENIPVLWRPYHEMNGIWFWWCNRRGEDGFAKLWKMMYDRFTNHHKLNNLIWVWNPNAPRDKENDEAYAYDMYFPGLDYVDILAADVYHNDYKQSHHDDLLKLAGNKPIAMGEIGQHPEIKKIHEQPQWTWFMTWANFLIKKNDPDSVKALYNDPRVLTLDEVNRDEKGNYSIVQE